MKSEEEIKDLLKKKFEGKGNFQQTEFNSCAGSSRRDFVILGDDYFHYYEIKTEKDNFSRLPFQIANAIGLFTGMFLVAPQKKLRRFRPLYESAIGTLPIEALIEALEEKPWTQKYKWRLAIEKVMEVLWADDLRSFIKRKDPNFKRLSKTVDILQKEFLFHYSDKDCLKVLNEVLPNRRYDFREINGSKNL